MVSHVFPVAASFSNIVNTLWKEIKIAEKERCLPVLDTDVVNFFFPLFFFFFCQLLKSSSVHLVKSVRIHPLQRG